MASANGSRGAHALLGRLSLAAAGRLWVCPCHRRQRRARRGGPFHHGTQVNAEEDSYYDLPERSHETASMAGLQDNDDPNGRHPPTCPTHDRKQLAQSPRPTETGRVRLKPVAPLDGPAPPAHGAQRERRCPVRTFSVHHFFIYPVVNVSGIRETAPAPLFATMPVSRALDGKKMRSLWCRLEQVPR